MSPVAPMISGMNSDPHPPPDQPGEIAVFIIRRDTKCSECVEALRAQFPRCPEAEARRIAEWTCEKRSGRVGRTAAAMALDPRPLRLAVIAHLRHAHTLYDELLMGHGDRHLARAQVADDIDRVLAAWEG